MKQKKTENTWKISKCDKKNPDKSDKFLEKSMVKFKSSYTQIISYEPIGRV